MIRFGLVGAPICGHFKSRTRPRFCPLPFTSIFAVVGASLAVLVSLLTSSNLAEAATVSSHAAGTSDTFSWTACASSCEYPSPTDENLFLFVTGTANFVNASEAQWGAIAPCKLTGAVLTYANGTTQSFPPTTTLASAAGTNLISHVVVSGVDCTNTVGAIGITPTPDGKGYYVPYNNGSVESYGDTTFPSGSPNVDVEPMAALVSESPNGGAANGYLEVSALGATQSQGFDFHGSIPAFTELNAPIVGMAVTPDGGGYWMVASDGGVFAFGDAKFYGSMGGIRLNQPIVGMAADDATGGYWLVAADGGVFSFNAPFYGSTGNIKLNKPIVGMEVAPDGSGYRFVASDGGVFDFHLPFAGSLGGDPPTSQVVGMASSGNDGYWLVEHNGDVQPFGSAVAEPLDPQPT
jgi:hypothetical protein